MHVGTTWRPHWIPQSSSFLLACPEQDMSFFALLQNSKWDNREHFSGHISLSYVHHPCKCRLLLWVVCFYIVTCYMANHSVHFYVHICSWKSYRNGPLSSYWSVHFSSFPLSCLTYHEFSQIALHQTTMIISSLRHVFDLIANVDKIVVSNSWDMQILFERISVLTGSAELTALSVSKPHFFIWMKD